MKKITLFAVVLLIGSITFSSCNKYEDGPSVSLLTKKMRLDGEWTFDSYYVNDVNKTSDYLLFIESFTMSIDKSGTWTSQATDAIFHLTASENGTWEFASDKEDLTVVTTSNNPTSTETFHILRLTNSEFWYYTTGSNGDKNEVHMKAQ